VYNLQGISYGFEDETVYRVGPFRKTTPLDMTGASDVFAASYSAAIFQLKSVPEALTLASANAVSVMSVMGARAGILRKPALRTLKAKTSIL
jgi:sugar/nucleoside kinase (ribokinase family)